MINHRLLIICFKLDDNDDEVDDDDDDDDNRYAND